MNFYDFQVRHASVTRRDLQLRDAIRPDGDLPFYLESRGELRLLPIFLRRRIAAGAVMAVVTIELMLGGEAFDPSSTR